MTQPLNAKPDVFTLLAMKAKTSKQARKAKLFIYASVVAMIVLFIFLTITPPANPSLKAICDLIALTIAVMVPINTILLIRAFTLRQKDLQETGL